jgi:hypothetical protein
VLPGLDVAAIRHYCGPRVSPNALRHVRIDELDRDLICIFWS